jgi:hypothetical protein
VFGLITGFIERWYPRTKPYDDHNLADIIKKIVIAMEDSKLTEVPSLKHLLKVSK